MSDSKFITIIRPDFMDFCGDACRAAAFNHLLFRIAGKSKDQPKERIKKGDILWYATTGQIVEEMSHAWGDCKVRKEVNALISMGIVGRRSNPEWGADRTKHFCFGQKECKKFLALCQKYAICVVHLGLSPEVTHLIYSSNANDICIKCICSIHQMEALHVSNANDISIGAIPIDSPTIDDYKDVIKEESALVAASSPNEHARALEYKNDYHSYSHDETMGHKAWNCEAWCRAHEKTCSDYQAWIESGGRDEPTDKMQAVKIGASNGTRPPADYHALLSDQRGHQDSGHPAQAVVSASIPGRAASPPAAATVPHSLQAQDGATTALESGEPRASGVTWESILDDWTAVQGRPQSRTDRLLKAARAGVEADPTREELKGCRDWLPTTDNPKKPWYRLHGVELWDVIEKLGAYRSYLALSIEPAPLADMKPVKPIDIYTAAALDPKRNSIEKLKERQQQARLKREAAQQQGGAL